MSCIRLGEYLDRHFAWGRGSILTRLTGEPGTLAAVLAEASRAARNVLAEAPPEKLQSLQNAAVNAQTIAAQFGVGARNTYRPHLDVHSVSVGVSGLSLHDGDVPLRRAGLATRRLLAVAMQHHLAEAGGLTLIDEVEHGLEPHRLRQLLRVLKGNQLPSAQAPENNGPLSRHAIMTTHSPIALSELKAKDLRIVRSKNGDTEVRKVPDNLQRVLLKTSEAFLARKVIVCEGKTELGVCRRFDQWWAKSGPSFAFSGAALADGGGTDAPSVALAFAQLGYETVLFGDSDRPLVPDRTTLEAAGARVILWNDNLAIEQRITLDLPWAGVASVIRFAMGLCGEQGVRDAIASRMKVAVTAFPGNPDEWQGLGFDEAQLRAAVGSTAKDHKIGNRSGWFKRVDLAEDLADLIIPHFGGILGTNLGQNLAALRNWVHNDV